MLALAGVPFANASAEARHFAVSWFAQATFSNDHDCSKGVHPAVEELYLRYAAKLGATPEQVAEWRRKLMSGDDVRDLSDIVMNRGRING